MFLVAFPFFIELVYHQLGVAKDGKFFHLIFIDIFGQLLESKSQGAILCNVIGHGRVDANVFSADGFLFSAPNDPTATAMTGGVRRFA